MNYQTHNDNPELDINGTSLRGYLRCSFADLVATFGLPEGYEEGYDFYDSHDYGDSDDYEKVKGNWIIQFVDGTVATIYDWKNGNPLGSIKEWNIGGFHDGPDPVALVRDALRHGPRKG